VAEALGNRDYLQEMSDPRAEMFQSVCAGLEAAHRMVPDANVLLQPGDHPEVQRATLNAIIDATAEHPNHAIMPCFQGRGGHPVLIPASLVETVLGYDGPGGLRQFWIDHPQVCRRIPVDDPTVVLDLDTPSDYQSAN